MVIKEKLLMFNERILIIKRNILYIKKMIFDFNERDRTIRINNCIGNTIGIIIKLKEDINNKEYIKMFPYEKLIVLLKSLKLDYEKEFDNIYIPGVNNTLNDIIWILNESEIEFNT